MKLKKSGRRYATIAVNLFNACSVSSNHEKTLHANTLALGWFGSTFYVLIAHKSAIMLLLVSTFYQSVS